MFMCQVPFSWATGRRGRCGALRCCQAAPGRVRAEFRPRSRCNSFVLALDSEVGRGPSSGVLACKVLGAVMLQGGPLSSTRQRRALAALVVAHGEVVSADRLADIVWDGDPPSNMNALQTYMSRLRAVLGVDSIQTRPPGYALALP